jgi:uncharacterized protein (TIGR02284 family)
MKPKNHKTLHILNDLILIHVDRITGYEKAANEEQTPEPEMRDKFYRLSTESRSCNNLHAEVIRLGGAPVTNATITGKIYLHWLDGNNSFEGDDIESRMTNCLAAELAVQTAYQQALVEGLPSDIYQLVEYQLWALERAHQSLTEQYDQQHRPAGS